MLLGVTSVSVLLSLPALAVISANPNQTLNNRTLAQNNTNTNQQNPGGTNTNQQSPADSIQNQQNRNRTNTNQQSPADSINNQQNPSNTGTNQPSPADSINNQQNPSSTGTNQQNPAATGGTNQQNRTGTGTGTNQQNPAATGTNRQNPAATNNQTAGQQDPFTQYMLAGYAATQQRDYQTALTNFQRALQLRPNNSYAATAVRNVQGYLQRGG